MRKSKTWYLVLLVGLAAIIAATLMGCTAGEATPTPTPEPTATNPPATPTPAPTQAPTPAPTQAPTPAPTQAPTPAPTETPAAGPPAIPAGHFASGCNMCHATGTGGAPQWPASHSSFTDQGCTACHSQAS